MMITGMNKAMSLKRWSLTTFSSLESKCIVDIFDFRIFNFNLF